MNHFAVNIGEAAVSTVEAKGEFLVINAKEVKDSGMEIVAIRFSFGGFP